jgi:F0F1-type ATP synthase assembly protein I
MAGDRNERPIWLKLSGVGFELAGAVAGFTLIGYWVDHHFGTRHWGLIIGLVLGLIGGTYNLVREAMKASKEAAEEDKRQGDREVP